MDTQKRNGEQRCNQTRPVRGHIFLEQNGVCHWFTNGLLTESERVGILDCKTNLILTRASSSEHHYRSTIHFVIDCIGFCASAQL